MNQTVQSKTAASVFKPPLPGPGKTHIHYAGLLGASQSIVLSELCRQQQGLIVVLCEDMNQLLQVETELGFFLDREKTPLLSFPDWETLPYDLFSPHQDIISQRLLCLYQLPKLDHGVLLLPVSTLMQKVAPPSFTQSHCLFLKTGEALQLDNMRRTLEQSGYRCVPQVMEHGEFAVRGSILDIFPSGSDVPYRLDLFDEEIDSIRSFDPETQRTTQKFQEVNILPAREFPLDDDSIKRFRKNFREHFEGDPKRSPIYSDISENIIPNGIEYYLPLFFDQVDSLFSYFPKQTVICKLGEVEHAAAEFYDSVLERFEQRRHDLERPILAPDRLYLDPKQLGDASTRLSQVQFTSFKQADITQGEAINFSSSLPPPVQINKKLEQPLAGLVQFIKDYQGRVLLTAESDGRREMLLEMLNRHHLYPAQIADWSGFISSDAPLCITVAPLEKGFTLHEPNMVILTESQLFGERVQQTRRRRAKAQRDSEAIIRNLTELEVGAPVVHQDKGVGRYLGLQILNLDGTETEFLALEYAGGDKLYVPVSSLHLISRYTGASPENAPLHKLGGEAWDRAKRKAAEKVKDVAAELLDIYARREASKGHIFKLNDEEYASFASSFAFEETDDQLDAIDAVIADLITEKPMDRVVCGDVGFGKTEVAMRAAFVAANDGKQVAVLVPTTLLAQQHFDNFRDRFADWPFKIETLSRFKTGKEQSQIVEQIKNGKIDIVVATHRLLADNIKFKNLGLVIIDEEHRFGVRQKEKLKSISANVDLLTLTATPIPRTLNMALSGIRDLSIIATPPAQRLAVKTFVSQWDNSLIVEAFQREIKRGGQIYFLHNEVETIEKMARELQELIPSIKVGVAHGQMRERELEKVMSDFYHRRFNVLVCTTIIESGIDIPIANTIVINRADKLGLAQLHQLRGRVGRSHHRAYCYLIVPPKRAMTKDAIKRLEAIESLEELGAGFMLASHDLEIRGAGELLGDEQSGQIHEIGFTMYTELLERAVSALKAGKTPELDRPLDHGTEININAAALIPDDYLPDIHSRLTLYKRIASAKDNDELYDLQVEMIDRFGLLPEPVKTLIAVTELKLQATQLGVEKIDLGENGGRIVFNDKPNIDPMKVIELIQKRPTIYKFDGQDRLKINKILPGKQERLKQIKELLDHFRA